MGMRVLSLDVNQTCSISKEAESNGTLLLAHTSVLACFTSWRKMACGALYDSKEKKNSGLSQRPVTAPTVPSEGKGMEDATLPPASKTLSSEEALCVYWPISLPPEAAMASRCTLV